MRLVAAFLVVVTFGMISTTARAASPPFTVEYLDETTTTLVPGRLARLPSGALLATGGVLPGVPAYFVAGTPRAAFLRERTSGGWAPRASQPPIELGDPHALAVDGTGWLRTLSWQDPCTDFSRPVLQEEGPSGWTTTVLDTGITSGLALELDSQGRPWVAYQRGQRINCCMGTPFDLIVAHRGPQGWERDSLVVPTAQAYTPYPFAVDASGRPHVLFLRADAGLSHAVRTASGWQVSIVDTTVTSGTPQLEIAPDGTPHVLWAVGTTLWHAKPVAGSWVRAPLPDPLSGVSPGETPRYDLAIASDGSPRVAYVTGPYHTLVLAQDTGSGWIASAVGNPYPFNMYVSPSHEVALLLDEADRPTISFRAEGSSWVGIATTPATAGVMPISSSARLALALASSNPFRGDDAVTWSVSLPEAGTVILEVFDVSGRRVATSAPFDCAPGASLLEWDPAPGRAGTFFVRARVNGASSPAIRWHAER